MNFVEFPSYYSPVVTKLCEYLELPDVKNLSLVSKEWFLATNSSLAQRTCITVKYCYYWKFQRKYLNISVDIGDFDINRYLKDLLKWYKSMNVDQKFFVKYLALSTNEFINTDTFKLIFELKSLTSLKMRANYLKPLDETLNICLNLEKFSLHISHSSKDHIHNYIRSICKSNRNLKCFHSDAIDENSLELLVENCPQLESLHHIDLTPNSINLLNNMEHLTNISMSSIQDEGRSILTELNIKNLKRLELNATIDFNDLNVFFKSISKLTDLKLTILNLKQWQVLSLLAAHLMELRSLILHCAPDVMSLEQHRPIFSNLEVLEISSLAANDLMTRFSTPKITKITLNGTITREDFVNFLKDDFLNLEELTIQNLNVSTIDIGSVLIHLTALKVFKVYNCESFSIECINLLCNSQIQDAQITVFQNISSMWKFKLFNRKWTFKERKDNNVCELALTCGKRSILLSHLV